MNADSHILGGARRRLGRREFSKLMAAAGLTLIAAPLGLRSARAAANLTVFEWSGYDVPELFPEFLKAHGAPNFAIFAEEEEAYQKLRAGFKVDVSHPCTVSIARWRDAGLIKPIDTKRISRWGQIPEAMLNTAGISHEGKVWMMPWDCGNSTIVYRHDVLPDPKKSYTLLLDPSLKGKISIFDSVDEMFLIAGTIAGVKDHLNMTDAELEKASEVMRELHKNVRFYWSDPTALQQAMASGEIVAAWTWTDSYVALKNEGVPVTFMFPEEGLSTWMCGFVLNVDGPGDENLAYDYLESMLDPAVGKYLIDEFGYGHSNGESYKLAESDIVKELKLDQDLTAFLAGTRFQGEIPAGTREKMIEIFEQVKIG